MSANVLVVDDNPANLKLLSGMLKESGLKARPVPSGEMALAAARSDPPDLILLDVDMPEMDGYEVCRRLKADCALSDIPVLFISALSETENKVRGFSAGGVDYVTKPFQFEEVLARVTTHLELRRRRREIQESYERLKELEELRDNLVHMIVHDLRSPLMGISGCLQAMDITESKNLSENAAKLLREARASADRLVEMVSSLLDVSRLEARAYLLNLSECDLGSILRITIKKVEALQGDREVVVEIPQTPMPGKCDAEMVHRVVQNLLSNAYQFTPEKSRIRIGCSREGEEYRVYVQDEGPGIPREYHAKVFEKFGQLEARAQRRKFTTGLGLTFCKLAVEAHGGRIGLESEVGRGSTFWFTLPAGGPPPGS